MALQAKGHLPITPRLLNYFNTGKKTVKIWAGKVSGFDEWQKHREKVLSDWIKTKPGTRPWAWWQFDSPKHPTKFIPVNVDRVEMVERHYICWGNTHRPGLYTFPEPPYLFESEAAFLKRKNLLMKGELERINPDDFKPKERYPFFEPDRFGRYSQIDDPEKVCSESKHGLAKRSLVEVEYPIRFKI